MEKYKINALWDKLIFSATKKTLITSCYFQRYMQSCHFLFIISHLIAENTKLEYRRESEINGISSIKPCFKEINNISFVMKES